MTELKEVIDKARTWALEEIEKNGTPAIEHFDLSNSIGQNLSEKFDADKDIVLIGTILMDVKLGECFREGKLQEHVKRSSDASKMFLKQYDIDEDTFNKIVNCIEAHHGKIAFLCREAEICANADCYRFLHPKGVFAYFKLLGKRFSEFSKVINQVNTKMEEKWTILTLQECKNELMPYYETFKKYLYIAGYEAK